MTTYDDLVESILASLRSYTGTQEQATYLTAGCDSTQTTLSVGSSDAVLRGMAEIEDELIYVETSDSGGLSLPPFGRGHNGTTAAAHDVNTKVTFDPAFPRSEVKRAITQCVDGLFPTLYQIKTTDLTFSPTTLAYELPADCEGVIKVHESHDSITYHSSLGRWSFDANSPTATGKALNLFDSVMVGNDLTVTYRAKFGTFASGSDTFADVGLSESHADLILYGVTSRLIRFLDAARLQLSAVENLSRAGVVGSGDAGKVANQLYAMYQQRLSEERRRLLELDPPSIHFTR